MARNVVAQEHAGDGLGHDRRRATGAALRAGAEKLGLSGEIGTGGIAAEVNGQTVNLIESHIVEIKQACQGRGDRQAKLGKIFWVNIGLAIVKLKKEEEWKFLPVEVEVEKIWHEVGAIGQINPIGTQFLVNFGSGDAPILVDIQWRIAGIGFRGVVFGKDRCCFCPVDMIGRNECDADIGQAERRRAVALSAAFEQLTDIV